MRIKPAPCQPSNAHFADLTVFGVHPLGCLAPANTLKRGHQTGLERQNGNCCRQPLLFVLLAVVLLLGAVAETAPVPAGSAVAVYGPGDAAARDAAAAAEEAWARVPRILARIVPPRFPDRDFVVTEFGAAGDGVTDCTAAIREAILQCNRSGGGRVVVPSGTFLTGPIHLRSLVNLHISQGATVRFTTNTAAFLPPVFTRYEGTEAMNFSPPIYAFEQTNVAITGKGTLDGQGQFWHAWGKGARKDVNRLVGLGTKGVPVPERVFGQGCLLRPSFIQPVRCRNVLIEGVKVINSPMWTITPVYCVNVTIRDVTVRTRGPNTDGCNPDSCTDVWIKDCTFDTGDDCIAVKSGRDHDGRRVNIPSENIVIQDCRFAGGHGGVTMGSETAGGIRNVFAEGCSFDSPDLGMAMRFKTNPARGGCIENIYLRDCTIKSAHFGIHMTLRYALGSSSGRSHPPTLRNIDIRNSRFGALTKQPIFIQGYSATNQITDVTIANCSFEPAKQGCTVTNAVRISLINVSGAAVQ